MDFKNAEIGLAIAISVFDEYFKEMYRLGLIPAEITADVSQVGKSVTVHVDEPSFELHVQSGESNETRLHLTGTISTRDMDEPDAEPSEPAPFSAYVLLEFVTKPVEGDVPVLGMNYGGVEDASSNLVQRALEMGLNQAGFEDQLDTVSIDIFSNIVTALEAIYYPGGDAPSRDGWPVALSLVPAGNDDHVDMLGGFVATPGNSPIPDIETSYLPRLMGLSLAYSKKLMNKNLGDAAKKSLNVEVEDATIESLELYMTDEAIYVNGHASQTGASIDFNGPMYLTLARGTTDVSVDTSDLEVDVDLAWYSWVLINLAVAGVLFFAGVLGDIIFIFWLVQKINGAEYYAESTLEDKLAKLMGDQMDVLAQGLAFSNEAGDITMESTPDSMTTQDGNIILFAQVFVQQLTENLSNAVYSEPQDRFTEYDLVSGRRFLHSELARLVQVGKIVVPGYHDVVGDFMRGNPNETKSDNLEELYHNS